MTPVGWEGRLFPQAATQLMRQRAGRNTESSTKKGSAFLFSLCLATTLIIWITQKSIPSASMSLPHYRVIHRAILRDLSKSHKSLKHNTSQAELCLSPQSFSRILHLLQRCHILSVFPLDSYPELLATPTT